MEFLTRLKDLRRQSGLSQEQLANRIGVSRQAISKWESGTGRPEIEKLVALADVFAVSVDALLGGGAATSNGDSGEYRYESVTNYDIGQTKHFDIDCGSIYSCMIRGYDGEQLRVVSNTVAEIARHFKVSIDDRPKRLDVTVNRGSGHQRNVGEGRCLGNPLGPTALYHHNGMCGEDLRSVCAGPGV